MKAIVVLVVLGVSSCLGETSELGQVPSKFRITKINRCPDKQYQMDIDLDPTHPDGRTFNIKLNFARPFNANWNFSYVAEIIDESGGKGSTRDDGKLCAFMREHAPKFFNRLTEALGTTSGKCAFKRGLHTLNGFQIMEDEIPYDMIPNGDLKMRMEWIDDTLKTAACFIVKATN